MTKDHDPGSWREDLLARAKARRWFHRIRLTDDFETPGLDDTPLKLQNLDAIGLPADLRGKRVLDVGAWDGFFSFEMERRGAEVVAVDHVAQDATGFPLAAGLLGSRVEWRTCNIYALDPAQIGTFDIVLCLGVLYHLRHVLLGLDRVRAVTRPGGEMFVESHGIETMLLRGDGRFVRMDEVCPGAMDAPLLQLYPLRELNNDGTNFFAPNLAGLDALLRAAEFETVEAQASPPGFPTRLIARARAVEHAETAFLRERDRATLPTRDFAIPKG